MSVIVPTTKDFADYVQETNLGESTYLLRFTYNGRDSSWYLEISDLDENIIMAGQRIRTDTDVFQQLTKANAPSGGLVPINPRGPYGEPGRNDLLENAIELIFVPNAEL